MELQVNITNKSNATFVSCLLCGSKKIAELKGYDAHYLVSCQNCKFVFCNRVPTNDELTKHYFNYPKRDVLSPITLKRYEKLLDKLEKYRLKNNLIDVGCGDGFFLLSAMRRGWSVFGTEFTDTAVSEGRKKGIKMNYSPLQITNYEKGYFDVVTSFEVIEHINYPKIEASNFSYLLRMGGVAYVTTPNFNSISRLILKAKWDIISYPEHLMYFTTKTLNLLFEKQGFKLMESSTTGFSISRFKRSSGISNDQQMNEDEILREKSEINPGYSILKSLINFLLNLFKKGDALKAFYLKI